MTESQKITFDPIKIRYDGIDAEEHKIDLAEFGKSAIGISRIMATTAELVVTGNYRKRKKKLDFRVLVGSAKDNCISFETLIQSLDVKDYAVAGLGTVGGVAVVLLTDAIKATVKYLLQLMTSKSDEKIDSTEFEEALKKVHGDRIDKLLEIMDKMADGLISSAKQATHPINISCNTIQFGDIQNNYFLKLDAADKQAILDREFEYSELETHRVIISELDMKNATCMISLQDDLKTRFKASVNDPQVKQANNSYGIAMNSKSMVTITAKKKLHKGFIKEFIISDIAMRIKE